MGPVETLGFAWLLFTSTLGTWYLVRGAYRDHKRTADLAERGEIENRRDIVIAMKVREEVG